MEEFTDEDFIRFMESYKDGVYVDKGKSHRFYDSVKELSRSDTSKAEPLIDNLDNMYGLDWIAKASKIFGKYPPKTTDALYFRKDKHGNLKLHIIEFKFIARRSHKHKINKLWNDICERISCEENNFFHENECFDKYFVRDFKSIRDTYKDPIDVSFQLKPFEAIFITLPELYKEYCHEKNLVEKDLKNYLTKIKKYYWVVIRNDSKDEYNLKSVAKHFDKYNKRLEGSIFIKARAKTKNEFEKTLNREILNDLDDVIESDELLVEQMIE